MNVQEQIRNYIAGQPELKRREMEEIHLIIIQAGGASRLWFLDGKNEEGKIVSNPSIGYGSRDHKYADGVTRDFYQIGVSSNKSGISIYILGVEDKKYLAATFGKDLGKANVTGYCIRFKSVNDINTDVLKAAIRFGFEESK